MIDLASIFTPGAVIPQEVGSARRILREGSAL